MGTALLLAVVDKNNGPQLYMVEPSGTGLVRTPSAHVATKCRYLKIRLGSERAYACATGRGTSAQRSAKAARQRRRR